MPCNTIQTTIIELDRMEHTAAVEAFRRLGWRVAEQSTEHATAYCAETGCRASIQGEQTTLYGETDRSAIAREYAGVQVERQAKRYGWACTKTAQGQYKVRKR